VTVRTDTGKAIDSGFNGERTFPAVAGSSVWPNASTSTLTRCGGLRLVRTWRETSKTCTTSNADALRGSCSVNRLHASTKSSNGRSSSESTSSDQSDQPTTCSPPTDSRTRATCGRSEETFGRSSTSLRFSPIHPLCEVTCEVCMEALFWKTFSPAPRQVGSRLPIHP